MELAPEEIADIVTGHEIAELREAGYVVVGTAALDALFNEGVAFADYDEGKGINEPEPDGYSGGADEVRRRAVARAIACELGPSRADARAANELELALRRVVASYDPTDPSNLVGMMYPHEGELREVVEAQNVGRQLQLRLATMPGELRVTIKSVPIEPT